MSTNATLCANSAGVEVLPNSTNSPVCGLRSLNSSIASACCGHNQVYTHDCQQYCSTTGNIGTWTDCIRKQSNVSYADIFCQAATSGNNTVSLAKTSAAFPRYRVPQWSHLMLLLLAFTFLFGSASAKVIPSLAETPVAKRADTSCSIQVERNYTTTGSSSKVVSDVFGCSTEFCPVGNVLVDSGINNNNRTINGTSAADSSFDTFFDLLHNQTGHWFPAKSSVELSYSFVTGPGNFHLAFTPFAHCFNGTVTDCAGVLGKTNETVAVEACGPVFASHPNATTIDQAAIQGVLVPVAS